MRDTKLRKLQLVEYDLLKRFVEACELHGLRYYLLGGTLLGAIRHGGFIPWDDDVDVCMPRPDYEELLRLAGENPRLFQKAGDSYEVKLVSIRHDMTYRQGMAKITSSAVRMINRTASSEHVDDAWIDVIPLDGFPSGRLSCLLHKGRLMFWKAMDATAEFDHVVDVRRDRGVIGGMALKVFRAFCRVLRPFGDDYHRVLLRLDDAVRRYPYEGSDKVINLYAAHGFREVFDKRSFGKGRLAEFEDSSFVVPDDCDAVLKVIYGSDYMTPPPENDRNWHNAEIL